MIFDDFGSTLGDYRDINLKAIEFHNKKGEGNITDLQRATKYMNDTYMTILTVDKESLMELLQI